MLETLDLGFSSLANMELDIKDMSEFSPFYLEVLVATNGLRLYSLTTLYSLLCFVVEEESLAMKFVWSEVSLHSSFNQ